MMTTVGDMSVSSEVRTAWSDSPSLHSVWLATSESPEWIAARTDALLNALSHVFGVNSWQTYKGDIWEGSPETLADIVRRFIVRDRPTADDPDGEAIPESGYSFIISGVGQGIELDVRVSAGSKALGSRLPMHTLWIRLRDIAPALLTTEMCDDLCAAVIRSWEPATAVFSDDPVRQLARRGNWKIGVGYRTWISAEVGTVTHLVDTLTATELAGGTLISAPDDWPATRVVEAVTATLRENGLDEVPH